MRPQHYATQGPTTMTHRYSPAPRIDTLRRDIAAAHDMLTRASAELDTLHDLAYTRPTATSTERTSGGTPDWALDTNGDHTARAALQTLARHINTACRQLHDGAQQAVNAIRDLTPPERDNTRHRARITATEALDAIEAMERRRQRGEYTPHRTHPQPVLRGVEAELKAQVKRLRKENTRLKKQLAKEQAA